MPIVCGVEIGKPLPTIRSRICATKIISLRAIRSKDVGQRTERILLGTVLTKSEAAFQQLFGGEGVLVFGRDNVNIFRIFGSSCGGSEGRKSEVIIVQAINQETAGNDVAPRGISLNLGKIGKPPNFIIVFSCWQFGNNDIVIFAVEAVEEPDFPTINGSGKSEAWVDFVERYSFLVLHRREKICGAEAIMIVTNAGFETKD